MQGFHKTLATAKHGGCVQLSTSERERFEAWAISRGWSIQRCEDGLRRYCSCDTEKMWEAFQAALAAQPSPGGQGDALVTDAMVEAAHSAYWTHPDDSGEDRPCMRAALEAALAARQPVGEPVANPIHQLRKADGSWVDQDKHSYDYNVAQGHRADLRVVYAAPPAQAVDLGARPMETAPRDGTMVRLLVLFEEHATEDTAEPAWTIGACNDDNVGEDERIGWQFAGWCWTHDHFTEGKGTPVGWLPLVGAEQAVDLGQFRAKVAELLRSEFDMEAADPEDHRHDDGAVEADRIAGRIVALIDSHSAGGQL
jgi:hypothetical protein